MYFGVQEKSIPVKYADRINKMSQKFHCEYCDTVSTTSSNYTKHCRTKKHLLNKEGTHKPVEKKKFYECFHCSFRTNIKRDYEVHMSTDKHKKKEGEKRENYICEDCAYSTKSRGNFNKHLQTERHRNNAFKDLKISEEEIGSLVRDLDETSKNMFLPRIVPVEKHGRQVDLIDTCLPRPSCMGSDLSFYLWVKRAVSMFFSCVEERQDMALVRIKKRKYVFDKCSFFAFCLRLARIAEFRNRQNAREEYQRCISDGFTERRPDIPSCWKRGEKDKILEEDVGVYISFLGKLQKNVDRSKEKKHTRVAKGFFNLWLFDDARKNKGGSFELVQTKPYKKSAETLIYSSKIFGDQFEYSIEDENFMDVISSFSVKTSETDDISKVEMFFDRIPIFLSGESIEEQKFFNAFLCKARRVVSNMVLGHCGMEEISPLCKRVMLKINSK